MFEDDGMHTPADDELVVTPYALLRKGKDRKWDGWYDLARPNGAQVRTFVRVPSRDGFDDPHMACMAAEVLARFDLDGALKRTSSRRKPEVS
ncbi:MAG TPA: hypothetical protein PLN96_06585 [Zoogloea sp.]|uniref:hypothetical protein n=1 Tax=Zoogloea sp. TaxID=49181 RepID=UPI002BAE9E49|nr:hypothetical protein [Zoogloea sp.]HMV17449.1 hypothetical protein [Rhodocyclaceae bacterium]HMV62619.1 hypothetical protein [Rhodocyclaceae bacterium]HMW51125.1 hypothetical protein [Rhodocyclaceae bacterium]HMY48229.1 hypothetical protein [Rhodocyclaceae bacterium]HMZ77307.1 hypothetical protein [Rhodocyclaceae bacterium]